IPSGYDDVIQNAPDPHIRTGSGSDRPNTQLSPPNPHQNRKVATGQTLNYPRLSIPRGRDLLELSIWPVATASGSDSQRFS
ncbi:MAG TPA: hypothetical protein VGJ66_11090, partial [Pyrinomonadaceae bacterium]